MVFRIVKLCRNAKSSRHRSLERLSLRSIIAGVYCCRLAGFAREKKYASNIEARFICFYCCSTLCSQRGSSGASEDRRDQGQLGEGYQGFEVDSYAAGGGESATASRSQAA